MKMNIPFVNHQLFNPTQTTTTAPPEKNGAKKEVVAVSETRLVNTLRWALLFVLVSVTILVSIAVYYITRNDQVQRFEAHVQLYETKILETFARAMANRLQTMNALATAITSHAMSSSTAFPNVTLPDFALRGSTVRVQANTHAVHYAPVIYNTTMRLTMKIRTPHSPPLLDI